MRNAPKLSREEELAAIEQYVAKNHVQTVKYVAKSLPEDPDYVPQWRIKGTGTPPEVL